MPKQILKAAQDVLRPPEGLQGVDMCEKGCMAGPCPVRGQLKPRCLWQPWCSSARGRAPDAPVLRAPLTLNFGPSP